MILVDLGSNDEEKWLSIKKIKRIRDIFGKVVFWGSAWGALIIYWCILSGAMESNISKIGLLLIFTFIFVLGYLGMKYIYGTFFAWGMYIIDKKNMLEQLESSQVSTEEIVRAYCIGGHEYANIVACRGGNPFFELIFVFCIGIWLGMINCVFKYPECAKVKKNIKKKYGIKV